MYESPITKFIQDLNDQINQQDEELCMMEVKRAVGFAVDKDELIKALQYDRNQYEKGKADTLEQIKQAREEIDAQCGRKGLDDYDYCSGLIFARNVLDKLIESEGVNESTNI